MGIWMSSIIIEREDRKCEKNFGLECQLYKLKPKMVRKKLTGINFIISYKGINVY